MSRDPLSGDLQAYGLCINNPIIFVDYLGGDGNWPIPGKPQPQYGWPNPDIAPYGPPSISSPNVTCCGITFRYNEVEANLDETDKKISNNFRTFVESTGIKPFEDYAPGLKAFKVSYAEVSPSGQTFEMDFHTVLFFFLVDFDVCILNKEDVSVVVKEKPFEGHFEKGNLVALDKIAPSFTTKGPYSLGKFNVEFGPAKGSQTFCPSRVVIGDWPGKAWKIGNNAKPGFIGAIQHIELRDKKSPTPVATAKHTFTVGLDEDWKPFRKP